MIYRIIKRAFDFIGALSALIILSPIFILTAIGIMISDWGPIFYKAKRIGKGNKPFRMYKFRSMRVLKAPKKGSEASLRPDEDRIFPFGHFIRKAKIDELPQLINILNGTMSIVGPRPVAEDQFDMFRYGKWNEAAKVPVGLSGPAALYDYIYGDQITDEKEYMEKVYPTRRELEYTYVQKASLWYDLKMIIYTLICIVYSLCGKECTWILNELKEDAAASSKSQYLNMNSLLVELIQIVLGNEDTLSRIPSQKEWATILGVAQEQAIIGITTQGLDRLPKEQLPAKDLLLQWIGLAQLTSGTYSLHCNRARELTLKFDSAGFRSCVLKGIGLAQLYPQPESREFGDIDLWVEGNRKEVMDWMNQLGVAGHVIWHHVDADFFTDVPTEIHFHPCWLYNPFCNNKLQRWFDEQREGQMTVDKVLGFAYPSVQFNAIYSLVHLCHHLIEEGIGIRHIIDYYYVIKSLPEDDRASVVKDLKQFGLLPLAEAMMWVLQEICGMPAGYLICEPNEREGKFLLDEVMRGGNFGHYRKDTRKRNSIARYIALLPHYPREILWIVPWKLWHRSWMVFHKNG